MTEQPQPSATAPKADPQRVAEQACEFFMQAAHDERLGDRLALAATTVHIYLTDTVGFTLKLDQTPISAEPRIVGNAEVEMWMSADKLVAFFRGERHLAMAIMHGDVEWTGPVRKFLRIIPILRSFDFSVWSNANR